MRLRVMTTTLCLLTGLYVASPATAADAADAQAIRTAALDYIEGWYSGNAERMAIAVHPELAKRIVLQRNGASVLLAMTTQELIDDTGKAEGSRTPPQRQRTDVTVLDVFGGTASVRVDAGDWVDYMHLARWEGEWKIVNVLWELRPAGD